MDNYLEPTRTEYQNSEYIISNVLSTNNAELNLKKGSVIHELLVRPFSYLYSWFSINIQNMFKITSLSYLSTSTATENEIADMMLSNYFITRKQGTKAKGVITITMSLPTIRIQKNSVFSVEGTKVQTYTPIIVVNSLDSVTNKDTSEVEYIKAVPYEGSYIANIPVEAVESGYIELMAGSSAEVLFANTVITGAELTSPITGGTSTETDASMVQRASYNTSNASIGSINGIRKKFTECSITVYDVAVVGGEDTSAYRARYNNTNINIGGVLDIHIKTQTQPSVSMLSVPVDPIAENKYSITLDSTEYAGIIGIIKILINGSTLSQFTTEYLSKDSGLSDIGARLSNKQKVIITFESIEEVENADVYVYYMPGVNICQEFIDSDVNKFIGQDSLIKAAIPISVGISCAYSYDGTQSSSTIEDQIKDNIFNYVNSLPIGTRYLNFSDLRIVCEQAISGLTLKLPCIFNATIPLYDGTYTTYYSNSGILDIGDTVYSNVWDFNICFFSITKDAITLGEV